MSYIDSLMLLNKKQKRKKEKKIESACIVVRVLQKTG